ncbi:MAG: response regulator [Gemmataceae bacterium]
MSTLILLADDDPLFRDLLRMTLAGESTRVRTTGNGEEAWRIIAEETDPLLALLDWQMPGMTGLEICQKIRELPPEHLIYSILVTGRTGRNAIVSGLSAGANDYISKPFDHEELVARIRVGLRVLTLQETLRNRVRDLQQALARVKHLQGLLPICSYCKSIRSDKDYWQQVEQYLSAHADVRFSHGICPQCYTTIVEPQIAAFKERHANEPR